MKNFKIELQTSFLIIVSLLVYIILTILQILPSTITFYTVNIFGGIKNVSSSEIILSYLILMIVNLIYVLATKNLDQRKYSYPSITKLISFFPYLASVVCVSILLLTVILNFIIG